MGKTIAKIDSSPKQMATQKPKANDEKANSSDSEYSSFEDDDEGNCFDSHKTKHFFVINVKSFKYILFPNTHRTNR